MVIESNDLQIRRQRVGWALCMVQGTSLEPGDYELSLLDKYVQGALCLDDIIILLDAYERECPLSE